MIILDWIRNILGNNKKNTTIYTKSLVKKFGEKDQLEIALFDADTPLAGKDGLPHGTLHPDLRMYDIQQNL